MKLGIGLPTTLHGADRDLVLEWARMADEAGFHTLATIDKPSHETWDPLTALAAAAAVTERIRLATTILQLPNRGEVLVATQAAVVDQLSGGRLDLGVAVGGRPEDYEVFDADFRTRGRRFPAQIERMRETWREARSSDPDRAAVGPAPIQDPGPPVWLGGSTDETMQRAVEIGDGFVFGTAGPERMADKTPGIRAAAAERGREGFVVAGLAYVAVGDDPEKALEEATGHLLRYYGALHREPAELVHHGPVDAVAEQVARYPGSGIDLLVLFPEIPDLEQVTALAEGVLPAYR